ncbi:MAG: protoheme IX farnesyltransferase [Candidatus Kapaibacterium sp.]
MSKKLMHNIAELTKIRITFFVAISSSVGFILAAGNISMEMTFSVIGILILSGGSSAFNHYQEIETDSIMKRTKSRPLPTKSVSRGFAFTFAALMSLSGLAILLIFNGLVPFLLGVLALIWYNLIYTPMKKVSPLAVVPGSVIGALPPAIGWAAAGGSMADPALWALMLFFFIWQIPHFWFLLLLFEDDYREAGFPVLTDIFSREQLKRVTFVWVAALAASCMLIPLFSSPSHLLTNLLLLAAGIILVWRSKGLVMDLYAGGNFRFAFRDINIYVLTVVLLLSFDRLIVI